MPRNESAKQLKWHGSDPLTDNMPEPAASPEPFWKTKSLDEMTVKEWEALCDGCGQCCLIKLEDDDTGEIAVTRLSCKLLDLGSCRCSDYDNRQKHVPDCVKLTPGDLKRLRWLPETCAYRLIDEGADLRWWHYLVSGSRETVHEAGVSVRGAAISERKVPQDRFPAHIVGWIKQGKTVAK
jgi:uncharacterized cysteine cluster protein YcgN (CxxCxxCC family)